MKQIEIYTDGACSGNPGVGGWAAVLIYNGHEKEISGYDKNTTNNRMELFAIIQGVAQLKEPCSINIYSDSAYAVNAFNQNWIDTWQKSQWKTADKKEVKNRDLWNDLLIRLKPHHFAFIKVKGHADNPYNNRCDTLARNAIKQYTELV